MTVIAEPKPAHAGSERPIKGIVVDVRIEGGEEFVELDAFAPPVGIVRVLTPTVRYSYRPAE